MASSSTLTPVRIYHVFPSFHGQDVRKRFLSHVHNCFASKGIRTFKDNKIERGHTIGPELVQAIRESRVSIVVLSKNYASSSWCLDELVEIIKCEEDSGQTVMTIFYDVDPSDVRKQKGDFGKAFEKTCEGKTEEVKQRWSKALAHVATIAGEHSLNWADEAEMIQKIAKDVSNKLNITPSRDFEGMVGLEAHLNNLDSLLCLTSDDVKMIGIWGPAGIGKSTIARALYNQLSTSFQLKCFMGNFKGSCKSLMGYDDYDFKLCLQSQLLSKILSQTDMKVQHLGTIQERLQDQRALIILDDVDDQKQLETLAKEPSWFGSGSRIIITTEDKETLKAHEIHDIYHVDFPSWKEALEILCLSAFKQSSVKEGFEKLANKVVGFCGGLPLGLSVVGSSLRGKSKDEWEDQLSRIESSSDKKVENILGILRVGYESLSKNYQSLFLHIACFFNNEVVGNVISMLSDSNLDVGNGLKNLADKSLVTIDEWIRITMHHLLQQLGRQIVLEQSGEPGKRQFLIEAKEICEVLRNERGTASVIGISLKENFVGQVCISKRAFEGMPNLQFLRVTNDVFNELQIPKGMKYLPRLKLLHWHRYPRKSLPPRFQPDCLVELFMPESNLRKLWGGIQPLPNLKTIDLGYSYKLKEIPNLSKATNLEELSLSGCESLVELPSSISNLHKLKRLYMWNCKKLKVIPANINLASLEYVRMSGCSQLRKFPDISTNITALDVSDTKIKEVPPSIVGWSRLDYLNIGMTRLKRLTHTPISLVYLYMPESNLEKLWGGIQPLPNLKTIDLSFSYKLKEIPNLSKAINLEELYLGWCRSLVELPSSISNLHKLKKLYMMHCKKLKVIPANINLASLEYVDMSFSQLRKFPDISTNIETLNVSHTKIKEVPPSIVGWSRLRSLNICSKSLKRLTHVPISIMELNLSKSDITSIPDCVISLPHLQDLSVKNCPNLMSIPALSSSLVELHADDCVSLKSVCCSNLKATTILSFYNCLKLDEESKRKIIQQSALRYICLPGKEIPTEFTHKAAGNSVTISLASSTFSASSRFKACFMFLPLESHFKVSCDLISEGGRTEPRFDSTNEFDSAHFSDLSEHLFIYHVDLSNPSHRCHVTMSEITFKFRCKSYHVGFKKYTTIRGNCGVQIMTEEADGSRSEVDSYQIRGKNSHHTDGDDDGNYEAEDLKFSQVENIKTSKHTGRWSWLRKLGLKAKKMNKTE